MSIIQGDIDFRIVREVKKKGHVVTGSVKMSAGKSLPDSTALEASSLFDCGDSPKIVIMVIHLKAQTKYLLIIL